MPIRLAQLDFQEEHQFRELSEKPTSLSEKAIGTKVEMLAP